MIMNNDLSKVFKACGFDKVDEKLANDINKIIDWQEELKKVDTTDVKPMFNTLGDVEYIYNPDIVKATEDKIFDNAPEKEDDFFLVPKVVVK